MWTGGRGFGPEKRRSLKAREFWDKYRPKDVPSEAERASRKTYPSSSGVTWTTIPSLKYAGPTDVPFNCPITACQLLMTATLENVGLPIVLDVVYSCFGVHINRLRTELRLPSRGTTGQKARRNEGKRVCLSRDML